MGLVGKAPATLLDYQYCLTHARRRPILQGILVKLIRYRDEINEESAW